MKARLPGSGVRARRDDEDNTSKFKEKGEGI
jgi:hypothetical protein